MLLIFARESGNVMALKGYNTHVLGNGLRVIHLPSTSPVVFCGYAIAVGARHEPRGSEGLAHFCEHTTFKGTRRRTSMQIVNRLERVGGELNAFTTKEDTVFYAAILREHLPKAVDLLTDIVFHSTYPQHEIEKEVEVICDEIESYNDSPSELIFDEIENYCFSGHPLGHNILGSAERVRTFTTADALAFTGNHYRPGNAVFFAYGDIDFMKLVKLLERLTPCQSSSIAAVSSDEMGKNYASTLLPPYSASTIEQDRHTHQAHVMLGVRAYAFNSNRRMPLFLLNNIIGGPGMNSRLNVALRERNGLVYTAESSMVVYSDTGLWRAYFGCDPHDVERCLALVRRELHKLAYQPLSARQLQAAKQQLKGQIGVASDNRENFALDFAESFLLFGKPKDLPLLYSRIDAVSAEQVQAVAQELFDPAHLTTLIFR